jgi:hypothetical protein
LDQDTIYHEFGYFHGIYLSECKSLVTLTKTLNVEVFSNLSGCTSLIWLFETLTIVERLNPSYFINLTGSLEDYLFDYFEGWA